MKQYTIPFLCLFAAACGGNNHPAVPALTARQKLDSIKVGMPLEEVMLIYGLQDTIGRSQQSGEYGYELDTLTMESKQGSEPVSPIVSIIMTDSTYLMFAKGKLVIKPELTWEEQKSDTMMMRILSSMPDSLK
jgi:hypothetical protein